MNILFSTYPTDLEDSLSDGITSPTASAQFPQSQVRPG